MNNLKKRIYRAVQKGLLEGLDLNDLNIEDLNDVKINKVSSSKRSI